MTADTTSVLAAGFEDEFGPWLADALRGPSFAAAFERARIEDEAAFCPPLAVDGREYYRRQRRRQRRRR